MLQEQVHDGWRSRWSAAEPMTIDYCFVGADEAWRQGAQPDFQSRDLGLAEASRGLMSAEHRRATGGRATGPGGWLSHDLDFRFLYVLKGSLALENELGDSPTLGAGAVALHGPSLRYAETAKSADLELIEITAPAKSASALGRETRAAPHRAPAGGAQRALYLPETPASFVVGAGPRRYFAYRDLGTAEFTRRRIHIHVVKALEPMPGGTGWHNHTMSQLFVVLQGWADLVAEGHGERRMHAGDAMCLRAGMRHDVPAYSADYRVLEMCIPADYDTAATEAPAAA